MQPAEYVLDHRFFNKTATIVSNVNTQAVQSIKYTPGTSTSQITETYGQTINGGFTIKEEGASVSLGFAVSQTKSITTDEITISIRTVDGSTTSTNHLETKFSFQQYKSKTATNRSLMRFNQVHVYYVDKTTYSNDVIATFKGSLSVSFYRNGFWNNHTMDDYTPFEIRGIKL
ncbi:hypothetical protein BN85301100 [Paracholeplasma brassicae]|uniref:Uncharacterized protein n=1 Tax=Acholeplasma brassicae TaxID=61635 RepID=U4KM92_9MOLU|nr:hypothetical protein [Paracholeplasma brassicae]CCV65131.1 hypothetical protein BN85301100 [Paracholeplasma brassicae]